MSRAPRRRRDAGIALFLVISTVALLAVIVTELTYSTQINARMAYNNVDNLKAHYLAKAGMKLSLLRLRAFVQAQRFVNNSAHQQVKLAVGKDLLDKLWNFPFIYPIPVPPQAAETDKDAIKAFIKESRLEGTFTASITSESSRLNLNNLFIKQIAAPPAGPAGGQAGAVAKATPPSSAAGAATQQVDFRPVLEETLTTAIERKKDEDHEFSDTYRNVQGKDLVDAIESYLFPDTHGSNLPGFKMPKAPKEAPLYGLSELHLIGGIDDALFSLMEPLLTVYSTPGINVNTANKKMFLALLSGATDEDIDNLLRKRDDPDVGKPWESAEDFWKSVAETNAGRNVESLKERLKKANVKIITDETSFKIGVVASHGLSTRRLEAYVIIDPPAAKKTPATGAQPGADGAKTPPGSPPDKASAKKASGLNLIYWRML